jgi:hypothetical protein
VEVEGERVGTVQAGDVVAVRRGEGRERPERPVDVEPQALVIADLAETRPRLPQVSALRGEVPVKIEPLRPCRES